MVELGFGLQETIVVRRRQKADRRDSPELAEAGLFGLLFVRQYGLLGNPQRG
jgi:hypothetical protein